jgi:hypothetical protein
VLYNGEQSWRAAELIEVLPGGLVDYRPDLRYLLIDENCYAGQAMPEGLEKGLEEGLQKGFQKGREEGWKDGETALFIKML